MSSWVWTGNYYQNRTEEDVQNLPLHSFEETVPLCRTLQRLSKEAVEANTSLIGFVGALTLASYTIEGKSDSTV
jgi:uroporphyrinogen-III decarboxylase